MEAGVKRKDPAVRADLGGQSTAISEQALGVSEPVAHPTAQLRSTEAARLAPGARRVLPGESDAVAAAGTKKSAVGFTTARACFAGGGIELPLSLRRSIHARLRRPPVRGTQQKDRCSVRASLEPRVRNLPTEQLIPKS